MDKPKLILVCGCSGVGKTTFAKSLANGRGYRYLAPDDFYELVNGDAKIRTNRFTVWMTFFSAINAAMEEGQSVVIDTNALRLNDRDQFLDWFPDFDHHMIFIDAPYELRSKNNQARDRHVPEDALKRMDDIIEPPRWFGLDRRWLGFVHYRNHNNVLEITEAKGCYAW